MKKIILTTGVLLSSLLFFVGAKPNHKTKVTYIEGQAWLIKGEKEKTLKINSLLNNNQFIKTGISSRVELTFPEGHKLRINENTIVSINELEGRIEVELEKGQLWSNIQKLQENSSYEIHTTLGTAAVRGTLFDVEVKDSTAQIALHSGAVEVEKRKNENVETERVEISGPAEITESEWIRLDPGQMIHLNWNGSHKISKMDSTQSNEWLEFNRTRDSISGIVH